MKTANLIFVTFLALLLSCRTVKTVEHSTSKIDSSVHADVKQESTTHQEVKDSSKTTDNTIIADSSHEVKTEVDLSEPDCLGNQHPVKLTITEKKSGKTVKKSVINQNNITQVSDSIGSAIDKSVLDKSAEVTEDKSTTAKKKTPLWLWLTTGIISLGLVFLAYLVLKRFNLVK